MMMWLGKHCALRFFGLRPQNDTGRGSARLRHWNDTGRVAAMADGAYGRLDVRQTG
jgi:hypothetical protein